MDMKFFTLSQPLLSLGLASIFALSLTPVAQADQSPGNQWDGQISLPDRQAFAVIPFTELPPQAFWQWSNLNTVTNPNQLIQQFYNQPLLPQHLGEGDFGCFRSKTATATLLGQESVTVLLTQMGSCDDSVSGHQTRVDFVPVGDRWQVDWVGERSHCRGRFWAEPGQLCP
ncbi:hypothetical protein IQ219_11805 [Synechocystis sp. LEGE 06083]|uniref:hypothetical protein n=1 Tax=Synechocystis sp. LEGE 06083 TaxID=915336 RepID=UPI00187F483A|nr:hypothetical protein [Synechocystis sp. LEGE 06083]MBE9195973.1 hypothetical protein [Synechocystis sp. LEGE 06083]